MAKSVSFNKREIEKKKQSKRKEKEERKLQRKASGGSGSFEDMIAYVDENGMITDTPPDPNRKIEVDLEDIAVSTPKKEESEDTVPTGHVDYFNADKGYGFIKGGGGPADKYFFHISNAPENIAEGNKVTFELERGPKGMNAVNITIIK